MEENTVVQLSEDDWIRLNVYLSDIQLALEHLDYESPAFYDEEGDSYLSKIASNMEHLGALAAPIEIDGVVSPSPLLSLITDISTSKENIQLLSAELNSISEEIRLLNESTLSIHESLSLITESNDLSSTILVDEVVGVKESVGNILNFGGWTLAVVVSIGLTYYLYKKVVFKWIKSLLKFRI